MLMYEDNVLFFVKGFSNLLLYDFIFKCRCSFLVVSDRYFKIKEPGFLYYWKKNDTSQDPLGVFDLSLVVAVRLHDSDGKITAPQVFRVG